MTGYAVINGKRIGFGDCEGTVLPALPESDYFWSMWKSFIIIIQDDKFEWVLIAVGLVRNFACFAEVSEADAGNQFAADGTAVHRHPFVFKEEQSARSVATDGQA